MKKKIYPFVLNSLLAIGALTFTACDPKTLAGILETTAPSVPVALSNEEVIRGLKQALERGASAAVGTTSTSNGFFGNPLIKIPFPEEAAKVKETALQLGLSNQVIKFEENMNRAAELAAKEATSVFVAAITEMSVADGFAILRGDSVAATSFLRKTTEARLTEKFANIIGEKMDEVQLTSYWEPLAKAYNTTTLFSGNQAVNPNLQAYVTEKALNGLFYYVALEEQNIRKNPQARVTDLLLRVFGSPDNAWK